MRGPTIADGGWTAGDPPSYPRPVHVELVHWPEEDDLLTRLRLGHLPRLVVVDPGVDPPDPPDLLEDWVRTTTPPGDIAIRQAQLARRTTLAHSGGQLSDLGLFAWRGRTVALSPIEARLTRALLGADGAVVPRQGLEAAGWPGTAVRRSTFDTSLARLRKRLAAAGLDLRTIRNRGYVLVDRAGLDGSADARQPSDVGEEFVTIA